MLTPFYDYRCWYVYLCRIAPLVLCTAIVVIVYISYGLVYYWYLFATAMKRLRSDSGSRLEEYEYLLEKTILNHQVVHV